MGSMHTGLEEAGNATERLAAFYAERALADVALIVTGGNAPNAEGRLGLGDHGEDGNDHAAIARSVTSNGGKILMQVLHAGRYGKHPDCVAPSAVKAPINKYAPRDRKSTRLNSSH